MPNAALSLSQTRRETRWLAFSRDAWQSEKLAGGWDAQNAIYFGSVPWQHLEYVEETKQTSRRRIEQHMSKSLSNGGATLMKFLKNNAHLMIWVPLKSWHNAQVVEKFERLESEAGFIWERQPALNELGVQYGVKEAKAPTYFYRTLLARRGKYREAIRLRWLRKVGCGL